MLKLVSHFRQGLNDLFQTTTEKVAAIHWFRRRLIHGHHYIAGLKIKLSGSRAEVK